LEHIPELATVIDEINRVLKKNGYLIIGVPRENILFKIIWFFWTKSRGQVWHDVHVNNFNENLLQQTFPIDKFNKVEEINTRLGLSKIIIFKK
jgi:SAM-dependent methyltransferase